MSAPQGESHGTKAIVAAFLANLGIAIAKFVGFLMTRSSSMLAESVHSLADTGNQGLLMLGSRKSRKAPTQRHPFGFGRERYFWSFVVALVLFSGGAVFAVYEGIEKIRHPHELDSPQIAIGILVLAILLEGGSFLTAAKESSVLKGNRNWWKFIRTSRTPELPVVLLEDFGALCGLVIALSGITLSITTGQHRFDGIATLTIGVLLGAIAIVLAIEMKSLLIGESALPEDEVGIRNSIMSGEEVINIIHLRTQHLGPNEILVATKLDFGRDIPTDELAKRIDKVEERIRSDNPDVGLVFIEPDIRRRAE